MPPFTIKVVIVHPNGDVEQHQVMLDTSRIGILVRNPSPTQPLTSAFVMAFAHGAPYRGQMTVEGLGDTRIAFAPIPDDSVATAEVEDQDERCSLV